MGHCNTHATTDSSTNEPDTKMSTADDTNEVVSSGFWKALDAYFLKLTCVNGTDHSNRKWKL